MTVPRPAPIPGFVSTRSIMPPNAQATTGKRLHHHGSGVQVLPRSQPARSGPLRCALPSSAWQPAQQQPPWRPVPAPWTRAQASFPAPFLARRASPTLPEPRVQAPVTPAGPAAATKFACCGLCFLYPVRCPSLPCFDKPSSPAKSSSSRRISPPHHVPGAAAPARPQVHRREHPTSPLPTRGPRPCSSALCSERARAR